MVFNEMELKDRRMILDEDGRCEEVSKWLEDNGIPYRRGDRVVNPATFESVKCFFIYYDSPEQQTAFTLRWGTDGTY